MSTRDRVAAQRERLAYEAARIMLDQGSDDFERARRKAADRIGIPNRRHWPSNEAVREALLAQRRLFLGPADGAQTRRLRATALAAMDQLADFSPRLVGGALAGTASLELGVELMLFADRAEDVIFGLLDRRIPWEEGERTMRYRGGERVVYPVFRFLAGDIPIELIVLPRRTLRHLPLDPVTDRTYETADRVELTRLLDLDETHAPAG